VYNWASEDQGKEVNPQCWPYTQGNLSTWYPVLPRMLLARFVDSPSRQTFSKPTWPNDISRWSVTSLRGPGERNFNAVSHKPIRAPIQSVFESWRLVGVMWARCFKNTSPSMSEKTCHWAACTMQLLPRRETLRCWMLWQLLARSIADHPNVSSMFSCVVWIWLFYFFVMYWTLALSTVNVTRTKAVIGFWDWCVCLKFIFYVLISK